MNEQTFEIQHIIDRAAADFMMIDFLSIDSVENLYKELKGVCDTFTVLQMVEDCRLIREIIDEFEIIFKSFSNLKATAADDEHKFNEVLEEIQRTFSVLIINEYCATLGKSQNENSRPASSESFEFNPSMFKPDVNLKDDMFMDFFTETDEHMNNIELMLLRLEKNTSDKEAINEAFRGMHSIKGLSGFLNLVGINKLTHSMESLLDILRTGVIAESSTIELLFKGLDIVRSLVRALVEQSKGKVVEIDTEKFKNTFVLIDEEIKKISGAETLSQPVKNFIKKFENVKIPELEKVDDIQQSDKLLDSIKVKIERIDTLVNMVGELVTTHNQVEQEIHQTSSNGRLMKNVGQMSRIVGELQGLALSMRMVQINSIFQKLIRLSRDYCKKSGKKIDVIVSGENTEIDRNVIEDLQDPLIHIVRNSIDHGIESIEERIDSGKPEIGCVKISAFHQSGMVIVEITDDGRGMDRDKIIKKAIEKNLLKESDNPMDSYVYNLVFMPGFSTAEKVTDISGRGVGMDVVKTNIERIRGKIEIETQKGKGSTIRIKIPLTLAIIDGMVIRIGKHKFLIPTISIIESLRPGTGQITNVPGKGNVALVRGNLLPLVNLDKILGVKFDFKDFSESLIIILQSSDRIFGIQVDELIGQQQVVIKNLGKVLSKLQGISGGAIMGDGKVGLILDPEALSGLMAYVY